MISNWFQTAFIRRVGLVSACFAMVVSTQLTGAGKAPMKVLKFDPSADKMELFAGMDEGNLSVRVVAQDAFGGKLYIENKSDKPITVVMPEAFGGVHVLKQVGGFGGQQGGFGGQQGGFGQQGGGQGGGQGFGGGGQQGGFGGQQGGGGFGQQGGGQGFFSIPPERVAEVPYRSVCLNFGKPDPSPRMTYKLVRVEEIAESPVLQEMLKLYGAGKVDKVVAQAAAWHLTDNKSFAELASITRYELPGVYSSQVPIFSAAQLRAASELLTVSAKLAEDRPKTEPSKKSSPVKPRSPGETVAASGKTK